MCRKNITGLENVYKDEEEEEEEDDDGGEEHDWRMGESLLPIKANTIVQMFALIGGSIQPGFEQVISALYGEYSPICPGDFNRIGSKIGCRFVDSVEWSRITVRQVSSPMDAVIIHDMNNNSANIAYDDVCASLLNDRIPFTVAAAEERLEDWIEDTTLPGAKPELIESYRLILDTWHGHLGPASPLEDLFAVHYPTLD